MSSFRIVIPTRDGARWVGIFLEAYRWLGVEPFYVVDSRSVDGTLEGLRGMKADLATFTPDADYAEAGMLAFGAKHCGAEWVLRLDDDEFPTETLLRWAKKSTRSFNQLWGISRRDFFLSGGSVFYSRSALKHHNALAPGLLNPHLRFFNRDRVRYAHRVHTSGLVDPRYLDFAPEAAYFAHFNCVLRSGAERLTKIRIYESVEKHATWRIADEYLPELFDPAKHHDARRDGIAEFQDLLSKLPVAGDEGYPDLAEDERRTMEREIAASLAQALALRAAAPVHYESADRQPMMAFIPRILRRRLAEALLTFARGRARRFGLDLWNYAAFMRQFES